MPFDWTEFFKLAQSLSKKPEGISEEARLRTSVSRAYYSCFCFARNYARDKNGYQPYYNEEDHKSVRQHFQKRNKAVADGLQELRIFRNDCDYTDDLAGLYQGIHSNAIKTAEEIFNELV